MTVPHQCPEPARLKAFLEGTLPERELADFNWHFESCEHCQQTLEGLVAGKDSWANLPRHLGQKPKCEEAPATEDLSRSEHRGKTMSEKESRETTLDFLAAADEPGLLGRLGHYGIQEVIGKGGFGIVLKAFDEKLHRVVAIKVLSPAYAASATARKRFTREAQAAAAIAHEHVVTIHAVEDDANPPYLVMQFIDGVSLQDKLDQHGPLGLKEILRIALQTAEGLAAAHKQGLVHRDIKPANILLENGVERVKITDFGLARAIDDASLTQSGVVAGTPMYMSPEQAEGHTLDCRSDLFSLGTVLYVMCTGRPPFRASGTMAVLKRVIEDAPRPIRETNPEIPDWLEAIIARLLAKQAENRFQTAMEIAERLGHHLAELQVGRKSLVPRVEKCVVEPVAGPKPAPVRFAARAGAPYARHQWLVAALLVMAAATMAAWIFWPKPVGTLRVEVPDQKLRVDIVGPFTVFRDGDQLWSVPPGRYLVEAKRLDERGHYHVIFSNRVEVTVGETTTVVVSGEAVRPASEEWVQLFNGKDLSEWEKPEPDKWEVRDSAIIGHGGKGYLALKGKPFENFHCRLEAKINADGWGGLAFRNVAERHANVSICQKRGRTGSLHFFRDGKNQLLQQPDKQLTVADIWFSLDVIVQGNNVVVLVNGTKAIEARVDDLPAQGAIVLCADAPGTIIHFRKIEIKELPPLPTEPGWVQLFNGRDLTGWNLPPADKDVWSVKDGILIGQGAECAMLPSERRDFRDFHLRVEAMINEGGDSGVWFRTGLWSQDGYEANINNSHRDPARTGSLGIKKNHMQKWLHHQNKSPAPANTWFTLEVIAAGPNLTVKVDTVTIALVRDANRSCGYIGLEMFEKNSVAKFRKIELKLLSPFAAIAPFDATKAKEHQDAWAKHLGSEPEITNSIGMKLRLIPPGEFLMGSSPKEIAWLLKEAPDLKVAEYHVRDNVRSEGPQRRVEVKEPFYLGVHEVTVGQFREFVRVTKHRTEAETGQGGVTWNDDLKKWQRKPENVWDNAKLSGGDTHPVVFVTLADAQAFCDWLTKQEGRVYAVPAEEHWEWACRAGTTTHWFFGDNAVAMRDFGWTTPWSQAKTKPVGRLAPNPFGLYDIYGNVQELTLSDQERTIFRGGQTGESPQRARSASRVDIGEYDPAIVLGFRVVIVGELKAKTPPVSL